MKRTPIRRVSKQRAKDMKTYSQLRKQFLAAHPFCAVYPSKRSTDVHHMAKRGINYLKTETWLAVSRDGHRFIHEHPDRARTKGWLV